MCISLFLYDVHPALLLLLTFNRDEFFDRPTQPAHFWPDQPTVLAGRDSLRKGTWLGFTKHGRFAFLTNYREPMSKDPSNFVTTTEAPSRGALTTDFLTGSMTPLEYLEGLDHTDYHGFNLLVGDLHQRQVAYTSNRGMQQPQVLTPGSYGVSNGLLQQWPKVQRGLSALLQCMDPPLKNNSQPDCQAQPEQQPPPQPQSAAAANGTAGSVASSKAAVLTSSGMQLAATGADDCATVGCAAADSSKQGDEICGYDGNGDLPWDALFSRVMGDRRKVGPDEELPMTGVGEEIDRLLSSIFVEPLEMQPGAMYGTRSQTVIAVWRDGRVEQRERYIEKEIGQQDGQHQWVWKEVKHSFHMSGCSKQVEQQQAAEQECKL